MTKQAPPFAQDPAHGNGTCEHCGKPCDICGPRWCAGCYYVDGKPRDWLGDYSPDDEYPGADYTLAGWIDECEGLDGRPIQWEPGELAI
ncbi:hypothetical protein [Pseudomonas fragariae (ex Marin et al. 2024)]|uniref:hypothetical protein n=1 Tax=Pseudomonas fragariae (ex Marin et al. 2024) TaxID=3080056 RepID=UPI003F7ACB72